MAMDNQDFRKEFKELGRERVRSDLMLGRFSGEKQREARLWLEQADAESWQKSRGSSDKPSRSLMQNAAVKKWLPYLGGAAFLLLALSRMFRH